MLVQSLDCETTTHNIGNPFDNRNKLCAIGTHGDSDTAVVSVEWGDLPYGQSLTHFKEWCDTVDLFLFFNAKFDLAWLWKYGIDLTNKKVWDCQLFEYIASNQTWTYPDLETSCQKRGITTLKERDIEAYWEAGIDTTDIPWEIIEKRVKGDAALTYLLYQKQLEEFNTWSQARKNLFRLHCSDLIVLHEIERNGFYYDEEASKEEADKTSARLLEIEAKIRTYAPPEVSVNLNSPQQVSALLYGGTITLIQQVEAGVFKTGPHTGQPKFRKVAFDVVLPRLVEPVDGTKLEKGEFWSSDQKVLGRLLHSRLLASSRRLLTLLLEYSKQQRSISSYTQGLPKLIEKMHWPRNMLYGKVNQVTVVTGRTSSSEPNLQNFDTNLKHLFKSRYGT